MTVILGTDTDAGKTTLALLWLTAFTDDFEYWKPVETGPPDSSKVAELVPGVWLHPTTCRLAQPLAPPLAARLEGREVPGRVRSGGGPAQAECGAVAARRIVR